MPVRNGEKYLELAVKSVLASLVKDSELLILNDNSSDSTIDLIQQFSDKRIKVFSSDVDLGVAKALNYLISKSDSLYISRMDADDICQPNRFDYQIQRLDDSVGIDFVFSRIRYIDQSDKTIGTELSPGLPFQEATKALALGNVFSHPTMTCRRSSITFLEGYRETAAEDYDLWLRAATHGMSLEKSWVPTIKYRLHENQITNRSDWAESKWDDLLLESYRQYLRSVFDLDLGTIDILDKSKSELIDVIPKYLRHLLVRNNIFSGPSLSLLTFFRLARRMVRD